MPFCEQCGKPVEDNASFCSSCGVRVKSGVSSPDGAGRIQPKLQAKPGGYLNEAVKMATYFAVALAVLAVFSLLTASSLGVVISGAMAALVYFVAVKSLESGIKGNAGIICIGCAALSGVIGFYVLMQGNMALGVIDMLAAVPGFMAWQAIEKA